ncbi:hypothetical protein Tco_0004813 [Tanacetum coccineum]
MGSCGVTIEGLYYRFINQHLLIPYPRIYKDHRQSLHTIFSDISRLLETVSLLARYDIMKNIFNSGRHKNKVGMQIPAWMITDEMKQTEHYRMYAEVFGIDVPLTQLQPTESTQGMNRTPSAPRRSTRLTPPTLVPTVDKADELILQDTLQVSLAEHKSREEQSKRNVTLVDEHIEPRSDKESPEVEIAKEKEVEISKEKERMEKGKNVEETRYSPIPTPIRSPRIHTNLVSSDTEKLQELMDTPHTTSSSSLSHKKFMPRKSFDTLADNLHDVMVETLPAMVDKHIKEQVVKQAQISTQIENAIANVIPSQVDASVRNYMSGHILHVHPAQSQTSSYSQNDNINYDDEIPTKQVSQDIMEEVSLTIDEAKLRKIADEMLR